MAKSCRCKLCKRTPEEIHEYRMQAEVEGYSDPTSYVIDNEGTYNKNTGMFYCTACYIKAGMPNGTA